MENKWFENSWNGERNTLVALIKPANVKVANLVRNIVPEYLVSLGFKATKNDDEVSNKKSGVPIGWVVNLVDKTFTTHPVHILVILEREGAQKVYPSQLKEHIAKYWASLTGKKFGI